LERKLFPSQSLLMAPENLKSQEKESVTRSQVHHYIVVTKRVSNLQRLLILEVYNTNKINKKIRTDMMMKMIFILVLQRLEINNKIQTLMINYYSLRYNI
jgi:hypothetical protein